MADGHLGEGWWRRRRRRPAAAATGGGGGATAARPCVVRAKFAEGDVVTYAYGRRGPCVLQVAYRTPSAPHSLTLLQVHARK
eukprot:6903189-Prymnesium_polylepis.1